MGSFDSADKLESRFVPKKRISRGTVIVAVAIQGLLLCVTLFIAIDKDAPPEEPRFKGEQSVLATRSDLEMQRRASRLRQRVSRPRFMERLAVDSAFASALPPLPELPVDAFAMDTADSFLADSAASLAEQSGLMGEIANLAKGARSTASFFGVEDSGSRIVIVVNTSASVVSKARSRGVGIESIQEEVASLVEGLDRGSLFGIVQFSQATDRFSEYLAPALTKNKTAAAEWIAKNLKGSPKVVNEEWLGHEAAARAAFALEPDLVFFVTDGTLNRRRRTGNGYAYPEISYEALLDTMEEFRKEFRIRPRIHVVAFGLQDKDRSGMQRLVRAFDGSLREF